MRTFLTVSHRENSRVRGIKTYYGSPIRYNVLHGSCLPYENTASFLKEQFGPSSEARLYSLCNGCLAGRIIVVSKESPCRRQIPFSGRFGHMEFKRRFHETNLWNSRKPRWKIKHSGWHYEGSSVVKATDEAKWKDEIKTGPSVKQKGSVKNIGYVNWTPPS